METLTDLRSEPMKTDYDFFHFQTQEQCNLHILNNKNLIVEYKCCDGKGFAILSKKIKIKNNSLICNDHKYIPTNGTCDICFEDGVDLYNTCQTCKQPYCKDCLAKIVRKTCPYCRGKLRKITNF
jgi:hypothetical protein